MGKVFEMQPPVATVMLPAPVAEFLKRAQLDEFTGKIILHMHQGHVGAVEPHHAPISVEKLTAKVGGS